MAATDPMPHTKHTPLASREAPIHGPRTMASGLVDGAADIFERGGEKPAAEVDEETVRSARAKIGELAVANDFLSRKLKPWIGK